MSGFGGGGGGGGFGRGRGRDRGGGGGGRFGGRGRGRGRNDGHGQGGPMTSTGEQPSCTICSHHARDQNCTYGDKCRYMHMVSAVSQVQAHDHPIKSMGVLADGPRILTGSADCTVKVWNVANMQPEATIYSCGGQASVQQQQLPVTAGVVKHIVCASSNIIMWSADETQLGEAPGVPVGSIHLLNPTTCTTLPIKKSEELPYAHPQSIKSFLVTEAEGITYVISGGGEGQIRLWKFDQTNSKFDLLSTLEGHTRDVTCLYLFEGRLLWSGSCDRNIRVWELASQRCVGTLNAAAGGHTDAVTALELITIPSTVGGTTPGDSYMVSGDSLGELKVWSTNGDHMGTFSHGQFITTLRAFQDNLGGQPALLVGLFDGSIAVRSSVLNLLFIIPNNICNTQTIWGLQSLGQHSCFASAGDDGKLIIWKIERPLVDTS